MRFLPTILTTVTLGLAGCGGSGATAPPVGKSSTLSISMSHNPLRWGSTAQASATITDAQGKTSPASGVTWSTTNSYVADIDASGLVTAASVGTATISATAAGLTGNALVIVTPGPPANVVIYSGDGQYGINGSTLGQPLCVLVTDARGYPVAGAVADYTVTTGGGTLSSPTGPRTDGNGIATSGLWTLGSAVGQQTIVATVAGAGSVTFRATAQ